MGFCIGFPQKGRTPLAVVVSSYLSRGLAQKIELVTDLEGGVTWDDDWLIAIIDSSTITRHSGMVTVDLLQLYTL